MTATRNSASMRYVKGMERRMKPDKEAITEILSAIAEAKLALGEAERAFQDMVKSMPTCREPYWLPQGFGIAGYEQGGGGAGCSGDEKDFVFYLVGNPRDAGRGGSGKEI